MLKKYNKIREPLALHYYYYYLLVCCFVSKYLNCFFVCLCTFISRDKGLTSINFHSRRCIFRLLLFFAFVERLK